VIVDHGFKVICKDFSHARIDYGKTFTGVLFAHLLKFEQYSFFSKTDIIKTKNLASFKMQGLFYSIVF